jgi:hypothetical protein
MIHSITLRPRRVCRAQEFTDDVLNRHQTEQHPGIVDHDGLMHAALTQKAHDAIGRQVGADARDGSNQPIDRERAAFGHEAEDEVFHAQRADHVVRRAVIYGHTAEGARHDSPHDIVPRRAEL